jgi:hypothetical protein
MAEKRIYCSSAHCILETGNQPEDLEALHCATDVANPRACITASCSAGRTC